MIILNLRKTSYQETMLSSLFLLLFSVVTVLGSNCPIDGYIIKMSTESAPESRHLHKRAPDYWIGNEGFGPGNKIDKHVRFDDTDIHITIQRYDWGGSESGKCMLTFIKERGVDWWKGIKMMDRNNRQLTILSGQDGGTYCRCCSEMYYVNDIKHGDYIKVEFWKAKMFGVHTHMQNLWIHANVAWNTEIVFTVKSD